MSTKPSSFWVIFCTIFRPPESVDEGTARFVPPQRAEFFFCFGFDCLRFSQNSVEIFVSLLLLSVLENCRLAGALRCEAIVFLGCFYTIFQPPESVDEGKVCTARQFFSLFGFIVSVFRITVVEIFCFLAVSEEGKQERVLICICFRFLKITVLRRALRCSAIYVFACFSFLFPFPIFRFCFCAAFGRASFFAGRMPIGVLFSFGNCGVSGREDKKRQPRKRLSRFGYAS